MDRWFEDLASVVESAPGESASSRLKSRIYTALVRWQAESGPLEPLSATKAAGHGLCVFEQLVEIAPIGTRAKSVFICNTCHARVLAEHLETPPIWWPHCPYVRFRP
jgi:hypothetical protein